jgi:hypothetical protein
MTAMTDCYFVCIFPKVFKRNARKFEINHRIYLTKNE